jgi:hypothetical protein
MRCRQQPERAAVECYEIRTLSFLATEAPGPSPNLFHTPLAPAVASCYNTPLKKIFPAVALLLAISFRAFSQLTPVANNVAYRCRQHTAHRPDEFWCIDL